MAVVVKPEEDVLDIGSPSTDVISIYRTTNDGPWECLHQFSVGSCDVDDLKFSKDGSHLIVWDS